MIVISFLLGCLFATGAFRWRHTYERDTPNGEIIFWLLSLYSAICFGYVIYSLIA